MEHRAHRDVRPEQRPVRRNTKNGDPLPKIAPLPGVLLANPVRCGKPSSRCARGELHGPYLYRRWREGGKQRRQYVSARDAEQVEAALAEWRRLHPPAWQLRQELAELRRLLRELEPMGAG